MLAFVSLEADPAGCSHSWHEEQSAVKSKKGAHVQCWIQWNLVTAGFGPPIKCFKQVCNARCL